MNPHSALLLAALALPASQPATAEEIGCATTAWKLIGANHRVCVYAYDDFGLAEDPSQFSLACRQVGPIALPANFPEEDVVFSENTSLIFKETKITRFVDRKRNVLVYLAISRKIIEGAPANAISTVPIQPWGGK